MTDWFRLHSIHKITISRHTHTHTHTYCSTHGQIFHGLSQLHQLRGRVGRGAEQSYCILMTSHKLSNDSKIRMETMVRTNDGFSIRINPSLSTHLLTLVLIFSSFVLMETFMVFHIMLP